MIRDFMHAMASLMWVGFFIVMIVLRHRRRMAEIDYAARTGQPLPQRRRDRRDRDALAYAVPTPTPNREVEDLKERIRVLERIATATNIEHHSTDRLAAEIEALRNR